MLEFFELLLKNKFISNSWRYVLEMIDQNISDDLLDKQQLMNLFTIYFSLIDDGNTTISLDEKVLKSKWQKKIEAVSEMLMQHEEIDLSQIDQIKQIIASAPIVDSYMQPLACLWNIIIKAME